MKDRVIMPANQNGWNSMPQYVPAGDSSHTIVSARKYDTSQYAHEKSLMQDDAKVIEKVRDMVVKNKGNNITEINLGQGKQYLPTDNSEVNISINDTGSRYEIKITATDKSNGNTYMTTYESLTDFVSAVSDSENLPPVNKEGLNLEELAGVGFKTLPPIVRSPFGNYEVSSKVMSGLRGAGKALGWAGLMLSTYQIYQDFVNGKVAVGVGIVGFAYGVDFIPYVGWALAVGIGVADYIWGINSIIE